MSERIDHAAEAERIYERIKADEGAVTVSDMLASAQVHATLAIHEQLRIQNVLKLDEMLMTFGYGPSDEVRVALWGPKVSRE